MMKKTFFALCAFLLAKTIVGLARLVTGVRPEWRGCAPVNRARIYVANHTSHGDFILIWTVLPAELRMKTRPVAARDYWSGGLRGFLSHSVFHALLIDRKSPRDIAQSFISVRQSLFNGDSLILFPEGSRNTTDQKLLPLKPGLFYLTKSHPGVEIVPIWIDNVGRVMPKGEFFPIPLLCRVIFGEAILAQKGERADAFLERVRNGLLALAPKDPHEMAPIEPKAA